MRPPIKEKIHILLFLLFYHFSIEIVAQHGFEKDFKEYMNAYKQKDINKILPYLHQDYFKGIRKDWVVEELELDFKEEDQIHTYTHFDELGIDAELSKDSSQYVLITYLGFETLKLIDSENRKSFQRLTGLTIDGANKVLAESMQPDDYYDKENQTWFYSRQRQAIAIKSQQIPYWQFIPISLYDYERYFKKLEVIPKELVHEIK